jgi:hypothetical protein
MVIVVGSESDTERAIESLSGIHGKRMVRHPASEKHPLMSSGCRAVVKWRIVVAC